MIAFCHPHTHILRVSAFYSIVSKSKGNPEARRQGSCKTCVIHGLSRLICTRQHHLASSPEGELSQTSVRVVSDACMWRRVVIQCQCDYPARNWTCQTRNFLPIEHLIWLRHCLLSKMPCFATCSLLQTLSSTAMLCYAHAMSCTCAICMEWTYASVRVENA